jgi:hypothetical protein
VRPARLRRVTEAGTRALALALALSTPAAADPAPAAPSPPLAEDARITEARALFMHGVELTKLAEWADALAAFERSEALHPHPVTAFNRGACQRALARYTVARETLRHALLARDDAGRPLPEVYANDARAFLDEIERNLVHVTASITPTGAALAIDGRPLAAGDQAGVFLGGVAAPGQGLTAPVGRFEILLDPGAHVFTLTRKGYTDAVVNRVLAPGSRPTLDLHLDLLPATLRVRADQPGALVTLGREDLGPIPIEVLRPAGTYQVVVKKSAFEPYESTVTLSPGGETTLTARLSAEHVPITKRWWFWATSAAVLAGGAFATYAVTRPTPDPKPYDGGSTGWVLQPK